MIQTWRTLTATLPVVEIETERRLVSISFFQIAGQPYYTLSGGIDLSGRPKRIDVPKYYYARNNDDTAFMAAVDSILNDYLLVCDWKISNEKT